MKRCAGLVVASALLFAASSSGTGDKVKLTDDQFSQLTAADAKFLHDALAKGKVDKKLARKVQAAALMISACAECSGHPDSMLARRNADAVFHFAEKGNWTLARQAVASLFPKIAELNAKLAIPENKSLLPYMYYFANERVGGFGVEQEMGELLDSKGTLTDAQFARLSDIGIRTAVIGQVSDRFGPERDEGKLTKKNWQAFTAAMRESALSLAMEANLKKEVETRKALVKLDASCTKCHDVFK